MKPDSYMNKRGEHVMTYRVFKSLTINAILSTIRKGVKK